jgi:hypothetical protein
MIVTKYAVPSLKRSRDAAEINVKVLPTAEWIGQQTRKHSGLNTMGWPDGLAP